MICLRRIAFRALPIPSTSISVRPRLITTLSPFSSTLRQPKSFLPLQKRWASQEVTEVEPEVQGIEEAPTPADAEDHLSVASAIESAANPVSYTPPDAVESLGASAGIARDQAADSGADASRVIGLPASNPPSANLYVGNLFFDIHPTSLKEHFSQAGEIRSASIVKDARGMSRGFGYVEYVDLESAQKAIEMFDMQYYEGRRLTVQNVKPKQRSDSHIREPRGQSDSLNPPSPTIFIGNMAFDMSDRDLNNLFSKVKNVTDVRVAIDRRTGQPRGFAHADFVDVESAQKAMKDLQGLEVCGRNLRLDYSTSSPRGRVAIERPEKDQ